MKKTTTLFLLIILTAIILRFFKLNSFPPALYSDEAALGYNAYSLLKTGKDEFGRTWPLTFQSFGDFKPPLSSWVMIPFIAVFGLNEFSVRLPFAIAGVLSVVLIYYLVLELFKENKNKQTIALMSAFFLTISPWHLNQSRSAMLVGLEAFFNALGVYLFLKGLRKSYLLFFSAISFSLAVYAYYGSRITAPLIILSLLPVYRKRFFANFKKLSLFIPGFVVLLPLFIAIVKDPLTLLGRAKYMSIFYDQNVTGQLWEAKTLDGSLQPSVTRFFHNKPFYYFKDITRRWLHHFEWSFLVVIGGTVAPFVIPGMGLIYILNFIFLLFGIYWLIKSKPKKEVFVLLWFLLTPLVSALTFMTPATNRNFNMIFPLYMLTSFGLVTFVTKIKNSKNLVLILVFLYSLFFIYYLHQYYLALPLKVADKWSYGRKQLVEKIVSLEDNYEKVIHSNKGSPPYIFLLFYQGYDPKLYWQTMQIDPFINDLGWGHINGFANYLFPREFDWQEVEKKEGVLYVSYEEEVPDIWQEPVKDKQLKVNILDKINYPNGEVAFKLFELNQVGD